MSAVFSIPAGIPFAKALAARLLDAHKDSPEQLSDILILLPTRRACRTLREAFLQLNDGKPMMLPVMQALGDIDEEELSLSIAGSAVDNAENAALTFTELPPVLSSMQRQVLLARAILSYDDFTQGFDQALGLAQTLGQLMDQIYTENLDIKDLAGLVPEAFAEHWQVTLDFLQILSQKWPEILEQMNVIDAADRRNRLIYALADFWQASKPDKRIIAAGTTGSIPATAHLLNVIANLPNGQIILPGLDPHIDDESWEALSESHPQYGFKHLLASMNIERGDVGVWDSPIEDHAISKARRVLSSELMRPAQTTREWQGLDGGVFEQAVQEFQLFECDTPQEEAQIIASLMRGVLEDDGRTAALITPDRNLAKRVAMACRRWGVEIDDSAGLPLTQSKVGRFLMLSIDACMNALSPVSLLSLLKHPLTHATFKVDLGRFEADFLRGFKPPKGIEGLRQVLARCERDHMERYDAPYDAAGAMAGVIDALEECFSPVLGLTEQGDKVGFEDILRAHIQLCEALHCGDQIWAGEDGNAASKILSEILTEAHRFPKVLPLEYPQILQQFLSSVTLRPAYGTHPRLQILGQLEARLIDADLVILSGLNEGTWPPDSGHDPWMSRPMRSEFGLPSAERSVGLSAHDFVQGLCAPNVALTRSKLVDGAPTIPARWLGRLETVLNAAQQDIDALKSGDLSQWVSVIDRADSFTPYKRPAPKPPQESRPQGVSITKVETWLKDPYSIYAYSVLKLPKLDPLEKEADAAIRGEMLHHSLHEFVRDNPKAIPDDADDIILNAAQNFANTQSLDEDEWHFYWPRFRKITEQYLDKEAVWRDSHSPLVSEVQGRMTLSTSLGDFSVYGRADRIDTMVDDNGEVLAAIIDYKSGGTFPKVGFENGNTPQLPLEALIVKHGGFEGVPAIGCGYLGYWVLNTKEKHTEVTDVYDLLVDTEAALLNLIETFQNEETPYYSIPRASKRPRFNDYEHLARVQEWAALDDADEGAVA